MTTRLEIAKPDIVATFEKMPRVLKLADIAEVLKEHREFWRLAKSTSTAGFLDFLLDSTQLKQVRYEFTRPAVGYTWGDVPLMEILVELFDKSYYTHYTAVRLHGLTEQVPKTLYLNQERSTGSRLSQTDTPFDQNAIDRAFASQHRSSSNEIHVDDLRVVLLNSAYYGRVGVARGAIRYGGEQPLHLHFTGLERTLIDIAIRPGYAGGLFEVAKSYELAKGRASANMMASILKRMQLGYPYHQAIGYLLERAGYNASAVGIFKRLPMERDFYLAYGMTDKEYVRDWRLYIPKGF